MTRKERWLMVLLRIGGVLTLSAFFTVFLPVDWMASAHRWLRLGEFPHAPIVDYLARSVSVLYAVHGGLLLMVSTDVRRYAAIVTYLGGANVALGALLLGIDLHAGMPGWWTWNEGPPVFALGLLILWLQRTDETGRTP